MVESTVGSVGDDAVRGLDEQARRLAEIVRSEAPDLKDFLQASHTFHVRLVALADCQALSELYERLGIPRFWDRHMADRQWWQEFDVVHHAQLVKAYEERDVATAKRLVLSHRDQVKGLVRTLITEAGGEV